MEIWRKIKGFDGAEVSSVGSIRRKPYRKTKNVIDGWLYPNLKPNTYGYLSCRMRLDDGSYKTCDVHKLMAMAFLNHKPNGYKLVVDHIDNNKNNNTIDNLQIISARKNVTKDRKRLSKYAGVTLHKATKKWRANIKIGNKVVHLGYFNCETEASLSYQKALINIDKYVNNEQFRNLSSL